MDIEEVRNYCIQKEGVEECFPFDNETLVFKVMSKIFLLTGIENKPISFNVKCDPEKAIELRSSYSCVKPGYHMNKKHWNTIIADGSTNDSLLKEWIDHSYQLVISSLPKSVRRKMEIE